ncbi:nucleoside diphosphate-linked moiety X motif 8 [Engraulis encrasicolus]|uniref:nucleoside diphosphate-linked moiety X motif 8 n=1 Tax=Engraulis encrasicolus TaxID=184585 RepID=UPI002FD6329D
MFRSPQLLTSTGRRGTHISLLLPKEALQSLGPIALHHKWNGEERKSQSALRKRKELERELPQDPLVTNEEICLRKTKGPSLRLSPPIPNEPNRITPQLQCSNPTVKTNFVSNSSPHPQSSRWLIPPYEHSQQNGSPKYSTSPDSLCRSDLKCLLLHNHSPAAHSLQQTGGGTTTAHNADGHQYSCISVSSPHGPQKPLSPPHRPNTYAPKLWTRRAAASAAGGFMLPTPPRLWGRVCAASFYSAPSSRLKVAPSYCLSSENEARCRKRLQPNAALYQKDQGKNWAAVLVSLCTVGGEPAFLFTLRSNQLKGRHKGDVSFAGGKKDPVDLDLVATALREAREELGVTVPTEQVWGVLKPLRDMSGMLIAPVLANLGPLEPLSFRPNPGEVEEIFTVTLAHVCNPDNQGYTNFRMGNKYGYTLPVFRNGKHRVWGLTAVALEHTLKLIVPP